MKMMFLYEDVVMNFCWFVRYYLLNAENF